MGILQAIGVTSLASSVCIVFVTPDSVMNSPRHLVGGYLLAMIVGIIFYYVSQWMIFMSPHYAGFDYHGIAGAMAVGAVLFFMIVFTVQHPPAAGFCLGLVIERWDIHTLMAVAECIVLLAIMRYFLKPIMKNLGP